MQHIPILMYHDLSGEEHINHKYEVFLKEFTQQISFLKDYNYRTVSVSALHQLLQNENSDTAVISDGVENVVLTFDDGHITNYTLAFPHLIDQRFGATFFITTKNIGNKKDFMSWNHVREMAEHGMVIGSHTHTHRFLDELAPDQIRDELHRSKLLLEDATGNEIHFFSCPGGRYNSQVAYIAAEIGYRGMLTSIPTCSVGRHPIPTWGRFLIDSSIQIRTFKEIVSLKPTYLIRKRMEYAATKILKRTIGNRLYHKVWQKLTISSKS